MARLSRASRYEIQRARPAVDRPYRKALSTEVALREIRANAGSQFDPEVVEAFTRLIARMPDTELRAA